MNALWHVSVERAPMWWSETVPRRRTPPKPWIFHSGGSHRTMTSRHSTQRSIWASYEMNAALSWTHRDRDRVLQMFVCLCITTMYYMYVMLISILLRHTNHPHNWMNLVLQIPTGWSFNRSIIFSTFLRPKYSLHSFAFFAYLLAFQCL